MSKTTKIWLITASFLILIGCVIFAGVMTVLKWDFTKLSTVKYQTNDYEIDEEYKNISIVTDTADIVFVPSKNFKTSVVCYERKNLEHSVSVKDGSLVIEIVDTSKWYEYIGINFGTPKITVSIPQGEYGALSISSSTGDIEIPKDFKFESIDIIESTGDVTNYASASEKIKIKTSTGDISIADIEVKNLDLTVSTGKITAENINCGENIAVKVKTGKIRFENVTCNSLSSSGTTGDITLKNVIANGLFSVKRDTGDIKLYDCDAGEIFVKTSTGNVKGNLMSSKVFVVHSDTGRINVPKTIEGGKCEITTDTGDIDIKV